MDASQTRSTARRAVAFEVVNAGSWSVVLGAPMMLYLKSQDASNVVLGMVAAAAPLLQVLQPIGAKMIPRLGYRGLMFRGWSSRTFMTALICVVVFVGPWLGPTMVVALILPLLLGFSILRGLTCGAFLPWMSQLIPDQLRGRFLAATSGGVQLSVIICQLSYAAVLQAVPGNIGFAVLFGWSCLCGWTAAWLLSRIPDVPASSEGPPGPVPWRTLLAYPPFRTLVTFNLVAWVAMAGAGVFWIPVLKDLHGLDDSEASVIPVFASLASLASLPLAGPLLDRTGSKPVLAASLLLLVLHFVAWGALAARWMPFDWPAIALIQITGGAAFTVFNLANTRLLMASIPGQGRSHFFALHGAAFALGQGVMPIVWGWALDRGIGLSAAAGGWAIAPHAWLYWTLGLIALAALPLQRHLVEPGAHGTGAFLSETLWHLPGRALARLTGWFERG